MLKVLVCLVLSVPAAVLGADLPAPIRLVPGEVLLQINGLPVSARLFASNLAPGAACALLEQQWRVAGATEAGTPCQRAGEWLLVSHRAGRQLEAAQMKPDGLGSIGFISELDPFAARAAAAPPRLPLPRGARLVNEVRSRLDGDSVVQYTIELPWPPAASLARLRRLAGESGWRSATGSAVGVIDFQRGEVAARAIGLGNTRGCTLVLIEHEGAGLAP